MEFIASVTGFCFLKITHSDFLNYIVAGDETSLRVINITQAWSIKHLSGLEKIHWDHLKCGVWNHGWDGGKVRRNCSTQQKQRCWLVFLACGIIH